MSYQRIEVAPLTGAIGAEVRGVDLAKLDDETFAEIHNAFLEHLVLFFRDQQLTHEEHIAFAARFGKLHVHPYMQALEGHPHILQVHTKAEDPVNFGGNWHSDISFAEEPALGSVLYGRKVPEVGGDTLFANMYLAYEALSDGMKAMLSSLRAVHSPTRSFGANGRAKAGIRTMKLENPAPEVSVVHPVVRTHPETGRKALYVNGDFTMHFEGMTEEESTPLLQWLYAHQTQEQFTCRFRWRNDSVAIWDNRCAQHRALYDYKGQERLMNRVVIEGDRPY